LAASLIRKAAASHSDHLVLGLYDKHGHLIHIGQAGTGFDHKTLTELHDKLHPLETKTNRFTARLAAYGSSLQ